MNFYQAPGGFRCMTRRSLLSFLKVWPHAVLSKGVVCLVPRLVHCQECLSSQRALTHFLNELNHQAP